MAVRAGHGRLGVLTAAEAVHYVVLVSQAQRGAVGGSIGHCLVVILDVLQGAAGLMLACVRGVRPCSGLLAH